MADVLPDFFEVAGVDNALLGSSMVTMCGLIGGMVAWLALETIGRYPLILTGVIVETISMCTPLSPLSTSIFYPTNIE